MKTFKVLLNGEERTVSFQTSTYRSGNLAVLLYTLEDDEWDLWCDITVNLGSMFEDGTHAFVDTNNFPEAERILTELGLAEDTGIKMQSGFCTYPLYSFDLPKLKDDDKKADTVERDTVTLDGEEYTLFEITLHNGVKSAVVTAAEPRLEAVIQEAIENDRYHEVIHIDEMFGYVVDSAIDLEDDDDVIESIRDIYEWD